ncbi:uncharacterized protein [Amphiura filiformis]|uniref:uncharacterized protein n=1 Tax=Amphiura filiformis TaxID=82378 RepID=UPI003B224A4D
MSQANCNFNVDSSGQNPCTPNPCSNNGQCSASGATFFCTCTSSWTGPTCTVPVSTPCNPNPCQNGGVCTNAGITYFCTCTNGFTGQTCQTSPGPTDGFVLDPCVSNPCQNGAPCTSISSITFRCNCRTGFVGLTCNVRETQTGTCNPNPCINGGVCSVSGTDYTCDCSGTSGFTGTTCEYRPEELCAPGSEGDLACGTRTCLNHNVPNEPSYVCVCSDAFEMGYDCSVDVDNRYITQCYGSACKRSIDDLGRPSNYFESLNYPQVYTDRLRALYLLYLPGVAEICFTFDQTAFGIENDKDELYVGPGLEFDYERDIQSTNSPDEVYFFEDRTVPAGRTVPNDFCIPSDTVWMFFLTDKNIELPGWRLYWSVEGDSTPPTVICPEGIVEDVVFGQGGSSVTWTEPQVFDNSGIEPTLVYSSHTSGSFFNSGQTTVTYVYRDGSENEASCTINVFIREVDRTPPVIIGGPNPNGITETTACNTGGKTVSWPEPTASDNSGTATLASRSHSPGQFFTTGTTTVTYRFVDPTNNAATLSFDVTVNEVDNTPPTCSPQPNDITRIIPLNQGSTSVSFAAPRAQDDCGQPTLVSSSHQSGGTFNTGTTRVSYVYRDSSRNQVTCSFNVIVNEVDSTPPIVSGSGDTTVTTPLNTGGRTVTWTEPTATDNSGSVTLVSRSHVPGTRFDTGTTRVTYVFRDPTGNRATYEFDVNVVEVDITPPTVSGSGDTTVTTPLNTGGRTVTWTEPTATDNSGSVTLVSRSHGPGTRFDTGTTRVTYIYRDPAGNRATYEFDVIVIEVDRTPPTVSGPRDTTIITTLNSDGRTYTWTEPTATDNSGSTVTLVSRSHIPGARFPTGTTTVTYVYRDPSGNEATYDFDVIVIEVDSEPPVVTGPGTVQVETPLNSGGTNVFFSELTATDNSGMTTLVERSHTPGQFFPTGTTTVTYIFRDPSGNRATYDFDVIVDEVDSEPPMVQGPGDTRIQIPLNGRGTNVRFTEPTATDNSGTVRLVSRSHTPGQRFPTGTTTVTYVFEDPSGNRVVYTFDVIVEEVDTELPVISGSGDTTVTTPLNSGGTTVSWIEPTATDNSGIVTLVERSHAPGTRFPTGTTRVRYVYQDPSGNRAIYEFDVIVVEVDDIPPVINHPSGSGSIGPDIRITTGCNTGGRTVTWTEPTATDNSGSVSLAARTRAPGQFFTTGTTPVTYRFADPSGNEASYMFNVIVIEVDPDPPTCGPLNDIELTIPLGIGGTTATWTEPIATDNCGPTSLNSRTHAPGDFFNTGETRVSYVFSDESGNFVTCAFNVQVTEVDTELPVISGSGDTTVTIPLNSGGTTVTWIEPTATDNSGIVTLVERSHTPGIRFPTGTTRVIYVYQDPSGNRATYEFYVNVVEVDTTPPQIIGSGDITVTTPLGTGGRTVTWPDLTANDNSGVATLVSSTHTNGQFFPTGTTTVTYTFTDPTGNRATYDFNVNVIEVDEIPPTVSCPANVQHTSITGIGGMNIEWNEASSTDNSGVSNLISRSHVPGSFFPVGETPVTYTFEDPSGNSGSCTFTVTISEANPCLPQPCLNAGTCVIESPTAYTCLCPECYSGNNCQTGAEPCENHNCVNGAACVPFANSCDQYYCECPDCFTGTFCTQRADPCANHQCQNGAQCTPNPTDCSKYTCTCPACFSGQFCQNVYDACTNHQCTNGGQCISVPNGGCTEYTCSCSGCFTGLFCQESRDPCALNPCVNGGTCSLVQGSCFSYQCQCSGCFSGFNCELAIPNPCSNNPCQNNGVCNVIPGQCFAYSCRCPLGFTGINCDQVVTMNMNPCTSFPCMNGGSCLTMDATYYICVCPADYLGIHCQTRRAIQINLDSCTTNPCSNGDCYNSYNSISSPNNNFVRQYTCVCENGFTGVNCALRTTSIPELDICNLGTRPPCRNGGVCFNDYHSFDQDVDYFCQCPVGFVGHNCENTYVNPCSSSPCLNGAQCNAFNTFFSCACPVGFTGILCQFDSVSDNQPPIIQSCPSSQSLFSPVGGAQATWIEPTATDNVDPNPSLIRQTHTPDTFFQLGRTTVTYVFTDDANNAATCSFYVTVFSINNDVTPPEITGCPTNNIVVMVSSSETGATATWTEPTATDNTGSNPTATSTHLPGTRFPVGTTRVTYTFTDTSRNAVTCSFNVVVNSGADSTAPVIANCPQQVVVPVDPNSPNTLIEWTMPTATDESGPVTLSISSVAEPRVLFQDGSQPVTITYVFTDPSGNSATCSFNVRSQTGTVDSTPPVIQNCPSDVQFEVPDTFTSGIASWAIPTATDNSGVTPIRTQTHTPGNTFTVGSTPVTYSFTDGSGNVARCTFDVIISIMADGDVTPPTLTSCPNDIIADAGDGIFFQLMTWTIPTATDDSGMALIESGNPFDTDTTSGYFQVGQQYITNLVYTFTDPSGNEATCEFRVGALVNALNPCLAGPCQNGGQCSQITNSYECACPAGFTGNKCQDQMSSATPCLSGPCLNGGLCTSVGNIYRCTCVSGFSGDRCQTSPPTPCLSGPCLNGGQCISVGNIYICTCVNGYSGDRCQTSPVDACSPSPCLNGGQCTIFNDGNNYFCTCVNGFSGSRCQILPPTACASEPCLNGGQCTPVGNIYRCTCVSGYSGDRCQISPVDACSPSPCLNGGQCTIFNDGNNYFCTCVNGFSGSRCQILPPTACASEPCLNGGQCTPVGNIYRCTCVSGYSGDRCQISPVDACSPSPCLNGGQCTIFNDGNNYFCTCVNGFSGSRCQILPPTACASEPCLNGGQCTPVGNIYRCTCVSGYSGDRCQISPTNACSPSPCLNNGQCIPFDMGNFYFCICTNGFTGPRCQSASQPSVTCSPSTVPTSSDSDISYSPSLNNFGSTGNVQVTYTNTNQQANQIDALVVTRPITTTPHSLDLPAGSNTVTVTASNGVSTATCAFQYFRTDLQCPQSSSGTTTSLTFPVPSTTFPDNTQIDFIRYSTVAGMVITLSTTALSEHTLTGFNSGTTTTITAAATDASGNSATCTFNYTYTEGNICTATSPCLPSQNCFYFGDMFVCVDADGRRRRDGEEFPDEYPCLNGGTQVDDMGASICLCKLGFTGIFCQETDYAFDICQFNPCDHNGTCVDLSMQEGFLLGDYVCRCAPGWTGTHCQQFEGDTQLEPIPKGFNLNTSEFIAMAFLVLLVVAAVGLCYLGMRLRYVRAFGKTSKTCG